MDTTAAETGSSHISADTVDLPSQPGYNAFSGYLRGAGRAEKNYNGDDFIHSEAAEQIYKDLYYYATYGLSGQDDPAVYEYWRSLGLEKKIYDKDDKDRMWSVFVPDSSKAGENKKFPLVFCLHGNNNNIMLAETYGFAKLGGSEGFITVVPWAKNEDIIIEEIPRILNVLRNEDYPIDESRMYVVGFSKGGMAAQSVALKYSDIFAAAAPGGCGPLGISASASPIESGTLNWNFRQEEFDSAYTMPTIFFGGSCDSMPINTVSANEWISLAGAVAPKITENSFSVTADSDNDVERFTGLSFPAKEQTEIRRYDGQNYYIGSYFNDDGICTFRAVSVEGAPHWLMPSGAKVVWEFLSQFARDTDSHKLLYSDDITYGNPTQDTDGYGISQVDISFNYNRMSTHASNQIAVWVENEEGTLVKTLLATSFTAGRRGYHDRDMALSHWVNAANPDTMSDTELDAVSSATPSQGELIYSWDLTDESGNRVKNGRYKIILEGTLYWESNVLFISDFSTNTTDEYPEITEIRSKPDDHENENMIEKVRVHIIR